MELLRALFTRAGRLYDARMALEDWFVKVESDTVLGPLDASASFPDRSRPLEVDLGCGKGDFLLARARCDVSNVLGVDRLLGRLRKAARAACREGRFNVRLLRMDAFYAVAHLLPPCGVSAYFIFFPDPWPKTRHHRHRLFNPGFMDGLAATLVPGGCVHVATDHLPYLAGIHEIVASDVRFEPAPAFLPADDERTEFERRFRGGRPVGRLSFRRRADG